MSKDEQKHELREVLGRQLLVALLEATSGMPLMEQIAEEFKSIHPPEARLLYLDICSLHRFGPPVRAGLISRIHNIGFDEFEGRLFKPLEHIVRLRKDSKSGDYVYEARHSHIANVVYETAFRSQEERFDNLVRVVTKLNPSYSYDLEVLGQVLRADNVSKAVADEARARQIYDAAIESVGRKPFILHQRGLYEMHAANNAGRLDIAETFLNEALAAESHNKSIKHSLAELDLKRSRLAVDPLARQSWRRRAEERAGALTIGSNSPYPYDTLMKAAVDEVKDALRAVEGENQEASVLHLGESIQKAEETLRRGLQKFPNEARLLGQEGELSSALTNAERAESSFKKAFSLNPRSTLLARRLVRILRSKGAFSEAEGVLRKAIEANPGAQELHYELATTLMESSPDADQQQSETILYHLRRSFAVGDKNFQAQFWYARQLCIVGRYDEAGPIFEKLAHLRVPFTDRNEMRGELKTSAGQPTRCSGSIVVAKASYGLLLADSPRLHAFIPASEIDGSGGELLPGDKVSFRLAFNLRGAVALGVARDQ